MVEAYWIENGAIVKLTQGNGPGGVYHEILPPILRLYVEEGDDEFHQGTHLIFAGTTEQTPRRLARLIEEQGGRVVVGCVGTSIRSSSKSFEVQAAKKRT